MPTYSYPEGNKSLIESLHLEPHPEGGFFCQTHAMDETVPSPFAAGATRQLATQIYYLLAAPSPSASSSSSSHSPHQGTFHLNKSTTYHLHHQGRAAYTLIQPARDGASSRPEVRRVVVGSDAARGEVRQLVVEGGWWKASRIPDEDLAAGESDRVGCLISEVVVPGFSFDDHAFLTRSGLVELFGGDSSSPEVKEFLPFVQEDKA
ncbi:hypothetical protein JCM9279_003693 [Rhodotorula babjevae]